MRLRPCSRRRTRPGDTLSQYDAVAQPGLLSVFGNHRLLYREPAVEDSNERMVLCVKLGGLPDHPTPDGPTPTDPTTL
jgi:hypothetical protein